MSEIIIQPSSSPTNNAKENNISGRRISDDSTDDTEPDLQFKPVVELPEVEVKTNEENETVLLKIRAKLYRFDRSTGSAEWKERGTGELKLLRHNENNSVRLVMRRDKTFKVCANHFITPWMTLKPCRQNERAFVYTVAADFADEELKSECLAIKFGSIDNANLFKTKFDEARAIVANECCLYNGKYDDDDDDDDDEGSSNSVEESDCLRNKIVEEKKLDDELNVCDDLLTKLDVNDDEKVKITTKNVVDSKNSSL